MTLDHLLALFDEWTFPLGPFRSPESVFSAFAQQAAALGPGGAPLVAEALWAVPSLPRLAGAAQEFAAEYAQHYPAELARELLPRLTGEGPRSAIEALGACRSQDAIAIFRRQRYVDSSDPEFLLSLACAAGEIGTGEALGFLAEIESAHPDKAEVLREIGIARDAVARDRS